MNRKKLITALAVVTVCLVLPLLFILHFTINRIYVPEGQSLQLRYKGPLVFGAKNYAKKGYWAEEGEIGIRKELRGPGRHFYCPIWWERTLVDDYIIKPGEVGVVRCNLGDALPEGEFLVEGDVGNSSFKGILRKVLHPGRYRINPYGYHVEVVQTHKFTSGNQEKQSGWVEIPTGYVGVVTNLSENKATGELGGIQEKVLPAGIYPINGSEQQIDVIDVGYRHTTIQAEVARDAQMNILLDEKGEPTIVDDSGGIQFPSADGFSIHIDFTAIWGVMPDQAPHAINTFGNIQAVENTIVIPQIESICRNEGSRYQAVDLLTGDDRERFQQQTTEEFNKILLDKKIRLLYGLVRHVYIPKEVREPIQTAFIADELTLTRIQEQETAKEEANLREAEQQVDLASETVKVETQKKVAEVAAQGDREARTIEAETERQVAAIAAETAAHQADAKTVLGEAENKGKQMVEEARSDRFRLAVEAFGSPEAYNNWIFATGLPDDVDLQLLYAGEGTLWTDMKDIGIRGTFPIKQGEEQKPAEPKKNK
ncbi:MAG: band 7 protein [Planctomyces sp.]|nr:band 7 protein [Planctomyces sp.]